MNIKCILFGHKVDSDFTDGGFHICDRCQMHEYWNAKKIMIEHEQKFKYSFEDAGLLLKPFWYFIQKYDALKRRIMFEYWYIGSKIKTRFSKINNDDLPF